MLARFSARARATTARSLSSAAIAAAFSASRALGSATLRQHGDAPALRSSRAAAAAGFAGAFRPASTTAKSGTREWNVPEKCAELSTEPIGADLAGRVADMLDKGRSLHNSHRDYCGIGLFCSEDLMRQAECFSEWDLRSSTAESKNAFATIRYVEDGFGSEVVRVFPTRAALVTWLARQSDLSLSGCSRDPDHLQEEDDFAINNQRISRAWMQNFVSPPT